MTDEELVRRSASTVDRWERMPHGGGATHYASMLLIRDALADLRAARKRSPYLDASIAEVEWRYSRLALRLTFAG